MSKYDNMTNEQWTAAFDEFIAKYDAPQPEPIKVLDLIMRRPLAEAILRGKKIIEVREWTNHFYNRMTDKVVDKWMTDHCRDKNMDMEAFKEFMCATRPVESIRFRDYRKSWQITAECTENAMIDVTRQNVENLQERFNFHELDDILEDCERRNDDMRPLFYYFVIGKIIDTNLNI